MADWKKLRHEFEITQISLKDLAIKYGVKYATLRSKKAREKWQRTENEQPSDVATHDATQHKMLQQSAKNVATHDATIDESDELNPEQLEFCELRAGRHMAAYKAYLKVYDEDGKMSANNARVNASRLMKEPKIIETIANISKQNGKRINWDLNRAIDEAYKNYQDAVDNVLLFGPHQANISMLNNFYDKLNDLLHVSDSNVDKAKVAKIQSEIRLNDARIKQQNNGADKSLMQKLESLSVDQLVALANQGERHPDETFSFKDYED